MQISSIIREQLVNNTIIIMIGRSLQAAAQPKSRRFASVVSTYYQKPDNNNNCSIIQSCVQNNRGSIFEMISFE